MTAAVQPINPSLPLPPPEVKRVTWGHRVVTWIKAKWNAFCEAISAFFERISKFFNAEGSCKRSVGGNRVAVLNESQPVPEHPPVYSGFFNLGAHTCYINSAIQALFWDEIFLERARRNVDPLIKAIFHFIEQPTSKEAAIDLRSQVNGACRFGTNELERQQDAADVVDTIFQKLGFGATVPLMNAEIFDWVLPELIEGNPEIVMLRFATQDDTGAKRKVLIGLPEDGKVIIEKTIYKIIGAIRHVGELSSSGHYVACSLRGGQWWKCDDEVVTPIAYTDLRETAGVEALPSAYDSALFENLRDFPSEINVALILSR